MGGTGRPPALVRHDHRHPATRCRRRRSRSRVIPIRREHLDAWLNPDPDNLAGQYRVLDDREDIRYVYEEAG